MFSPEERQRAVDLYFTTPMTTAQVVEYLGYPTRQCLERWLAKDPRYAGHMAKPIIPLETRTKAIELVLGGMAALQARNRNAAQNGKTASAPCRSRDAGDGNDDTETLRRRVEELELENALMREVVEVVKKTQAPTCGACRTGRRRC
ncbi:helix-turn-helix domain-containing protein [Bifidobacterium adolescentis]|uniref:helix-turn-helix domain-containing protein n=1 Tax=Bifidobacterium adolescentis TaxID=1680 RepID=UPI001E4057D8|nr:helix-turn-helix domain-containing protein [Bifidobacterium adolescentis]